MSYTTITACRACRETRLDPVLNLGEMAISDFLEPGQAVDTAPLELVRCAGCGLVQLRHTVDRDRLYTTYHYRSGVNETMAAALEDVVEDAMGRVNLELGDAVLDIGCNDGTLFAFYPESANLRLIGFDPSDVAETAWLDHRAMGDDYTLVRDYFPTTRQHLPVPCKIVTAVAMFYDLDDPGRFLEEVKRWLHPEGVLVIQLQDLWTMLLTGGVDNICHEHVTYWGLGDLSELLERHGLGIREVTAVPINGGSARVIVGHGSGQIHRVIRPTDLRLFADRARRNKHATLELLERLRDEGASVYGIAASTKFNTLSQFYGIGPDLIEAIGERSPHKVGKHTVTGIPIVSEQEMRDAKPDYLFCCAWQFASAFAAREKALLDAGTKLIVPLPSLQIVEGDRAGLLAQVP